MFSFLYHRQDFYRSWLSIWVTRQVSYKKQELLTLHKHLSSTPFFGGICCSFFIFLCCPIQLLLRSAFRVVMSVTVSAWKRCSVRLYLQLFVVALISYLRYLCLLTCSGVQHILCCVFVLFFFVLCALCCQFLSIVHFWSSLLYPLTFI